MSTLKLSRLRSFYGRRGAPILPVPTLDLKEELELGHVLKRSRRRSRTRTPTPPMFGPQRVNFWPQELSNEKDTLGCDSKLSV